MKNITILICLIFSLILAAAGCRTRSIVLSENGEPKAVIVVKDQASEDLLSAAKELQKYLAKISGAELPIKTASERPAGTLILVGDSTLVAESGVAVEGLPGEGFRIKTTDGNLVLAGKDVPGTQLAVYTFLENHLGVRWLWPGELGEVVPGNRSIRVAPIDHTEEPDFKWRDRGPGGALWGATSGPTEMRPRERLLGVSASHQTEVALWEKRNRWGGIKIYGGHALGEIFPPEKYARTHPDYYAVVDGKRAVPGKDYDYKHAGQVCTTNPGVLQTTVEWVRDFFNRNPDYDGVHITMNDGGGFCECDRCRALDSGRFVERPGIDLEEMKKRPARFTVITDRIFTFVNQVAEEVQKTHPGKYVVSMAYSRYVMPPERVRLHPFVIPQYCLWSAYKHANPELKAEHEKIAATWAKAATRSGVYEYYINGSWPGMHRLVVPYIADSIRYLYRQGTDLYQIQSGDEFAINGINYYVAGRLLWDTSLDEKALLEDFYAKGFGKAAPAVRRFHQRLQDAWRVATESGRDVTCGSLENSRLPELYTQELLTNCARELAEAAALADDDAVRKRVAFYRQGLQYTELTVSAAVAAQKALFDQSGQMTPVERKRLIAEALEAWERRDKFVEDLKDDFVIAYFWVKYNDYARDFNPTELLRRLSK